ncbi:hypothetical protein GBA63_15395 [Rubrobacter tropicus]|uniref:DUF4179 domain-containing protein n=1 Tax=Rubrobacter tropicus TaxID=2653851 RepID=A0A6G8QBQ1_9ACTN|nr:hypothetical protein [Rubrobacter tropicus]QIN83868.1 hypothetical protein GBA63_15395 [Rubrobacter tropicus]
MANQRKRLEKALRGCAEAGVPDTTDLWPSVKERVTGERLVTEPAGQALADADARRRSFIPQFVPNTPLGWVLAAVSVLILGVGVYAAVGPASEFYQRGLPGTVESGSEKAGRGSPDQENDLQATGVSTELFREALPGDENLSLAENVNQTVKRDGASVTLEWAYADTDFVVLGFSVRDLEEDRRNAGNPATLEPIFVSKEDEDVPSAPDRRSELTDQDGRYFGSIDGVSMVASPGAGQKELRAPKAQTAVFEVPKGLNAGHKHSFRFDVFLEEMAVPSSMAEAEKGYRSEPRPPIGPLTFDFEIPVRSVPVIEIGQKETVNGVTLTLERVLNSGGKPQAVVCFEPPNDDYGWRPSTAPTGFQVEEPLPVDPLKGDCWSLTIEDPVEGRSTVKVTEIFGYPQSEKALQAKDEDGKQIEGPWIFEFDAPER